MRAADVVAGRVHADHRIATAKHQAIDHGGGDAARIISGMVGLEAHRPCVPGRPMVSRKRVTTRALHAARDQVLVAHQLRDRRRPFPASGPWTVAPELRACARPPTAATRGSRPPSCATPVRRPAHRGGPMMSRVTSSLLVGDQGFVEEAASAAHPASAMRAATASSALAAAMPASMSPERGGRGFRQQRLQVREDVVGLPRVRLIHISRFTAELAEPWGWLSSYPSSAWAVARRVFPFREIVEMPILRRAFMPIALLSAALLASAANAASTWIAR